MVNTLFTSEAILDPEYIFQVIYKALTKGEVRDSRSDSEETE